MKSMFVLESTYDGAGTILEVLPLTDSEAAAAGETFKFSSGKLTKAATTDKPAYIGIQKVAAGTGKTVECVAVRPDQVWIGDYTSASTNVPAIGAKYVLDSTGLKVDADTTTNGIATIISADTAKAKCRCKFE
jgi:hypothetical protein